MQTYWLDTGMRQMAIASISGYQRYLSPHKGFKCAHRVLYGGKSCSEYVKQVIAQEGLVSAISASRHRFAACHTANHILQATAMRSEGEENEGDETEETRNRKNSSSPRSSNPYSDPCNSYYLVPSCVDCSGLDCISGLDCSGLDCSGAYCGDFGGCSW
jgi:putative component of membrane protein insertase Oxa1/YidC/SpoIIIJ protein YidD